MKRGDRISEFDLLSLRYALLSADHGSFRQAADSLGIRSSVISKRVRALEEELGVSLFERHSRGLRTTWAGRRFLDRIDVILSELDYAAKAALSAGRGAHGSLRIGIFSSLGSLLARDVIAAFREQHPDVQTDVREGAPRAHIARLRERRLDVALVTGLPDPEGCDAEHFWSERVYVALPTGHGLASHPSIAWDTIRTEPFIVSRDEPGPEIHDYLIQRLANLGHTPKVTRYEVGRENLMHMVALGFGLTLTSEATVATAFPGLRFVPVQGEDPLPFSAVWSPGNDNPALRRFIALMRSLAKR